MDRFAEAHAPYVGADDEAIGRREHRREVFVAGLLGLTWGGLFGLLVAHEGAQSNPS